MEENTKDLATDEMLKMILAEVRDLRITVTGMDARLTVVESELVALAKKVDDRLHDTRPMWQAIHAQTEKLTEKVENLSENVADLNENVAQMNETQKHFKYQLEDIAVFYHELRAGQREHRKRLEALEVRAA